MRRTSSFPLHLFLTTALVLLVLTLPAPGPAAAATVPAGFSDTPVVSGLDQPTAMAMAPDGRIFIAEKGGDLRVVKNGALLATPFLSVTVNQTGEREGRMTS